MKQVFESKSGIEKINRIFSLLIFLIFVALFAIGCSDNQTNPIGAGENGSAELIDSDNNAGSQSDETFRAVRNEGVNYTLPSRNIDVAIESSRQVVDLRREDRDVSITVRIFHQGRQFAAPGIRVDFETTYGVIEPAAAITNRNGEAIVRLISNGDVGVAEVTASVRTALEPLKVQTEVWFARENSGRINIDVERSFLSVREGGGIDTLAIRAIVSDQNGNPIDAAIPVKLELINEPRPPRGCVFQNGRSSATAVAEESEAIFVLHSGVQIGAKLIRATTCSANGNMMSVILSTISVVAGAPDRVDLDIDDAGEDAGDNRWRLEMQGRAWDRYRNPISRYEQVSFGVEPEIAEIVEVDFERGIFAYLIYASEHTFEEVQITVRIQTNQGVLEETIDYILPLVDGILELNVDPANWMFEDEDDVCEIRCWVNLCDGHDVLIDNAPILFTTNRGRLSWRDEEGEYRRFFPDPAIRHTGGGEERDGEATVWLAAEYWEIIDPWWPAEVTVQFNAVVIGYDDVQADPVFAFIIPFRE